MDSGNGQWAEKVHPLSRGVEPEDPMELMAEAVEGDPQVMLECILQEFLWMGWNAEQLLSLFDSPAYPMLMQLRELYGADYIRNHVNKFVSRSGVLRFRETLVEDLPEEDDEPQLVQITLPTEDSCRVGRVFEAHHPPEHRPPTRLVGLDDSTHPTLLPLKD